MLCLIFFLIIFKACDTATNVGTTLFYNKLNKAQCWSQDELAKLTARRMFQHVMPSPVTPDKINTKFIKDTIRYCRRALRTTEVHADFRTGTLLKEALADTIGGYLRSELLPTVRFAYYAGYVPYRHARELHDFMDYLKTILNTKGIGWKEPRRVPQWSNLTVVKILVGSGRLFDPCAYLVTKRDVNSCIHLPTPKSDDTSEPSAVALPFKSGGLFNLASPRSENILLKYYTTASRCILRSSPGKCRHSDFINFNTELWHWMKRDVAPHLVDEKLYGAYGGVLRIAAAVQSYGKGLSRRNLFEYQEPGVSKWHPWQMLTQSHVCTDGEWTPTLYIGLVLLAALAICLLQICYNYIYSHTRSCYCKDRSKSSWTKEVAYATVETTFPAMLPDHDTTKISNKTKSRMHSVRTKSSVTSEKTQRVYDLNENAEKLMVVMSGTEDAGSGSHVSKEDSEDADNVINLGRSKRGKSPPQLQTSITQLTIGSNDKRLPMYSTSTETYCREQRVSESTWTGSESSVSGTSDRSLSTASSKTQSRKTSRSRDLAWVRRVARKAHSNTRSTELDMNSFTTPLSER